MAHTIRLHGGPWHGQVFTIEDGKDHFHIIGQAGPSKLSLAENPEIIPTREGIYSRVGKTNDFEWDGWRGHDK